MKIAKVLNNNVVIIQDEHQHEQIVMGRGIAFKKCTGDSIDNALVEKVYALQNGELSLHLSELLSDIPPDVTVVVKEIVSLAQNKLSVNLHTSLYIVLADHCFFALERNRQRIDITNVLLWEIKRLYPKEFAIGLEALNIIERGLGMRLPEDEAGFIALHLVNAQLGCELPEVMSITKIMREILHIVKYQLNLDYNEDCLSYHRFITHLKFFAQRILGHKGVYDDDESLHDAVKLKYSLAYRCSESVKNHIQLHYHYSLTKEEMLFLTIHIEHVRKESS